MIVNGAILFRLEFSLPRERLFPQILRAKLLSPLMRYSTIGPWIQTPFCFYQYSEKPLIVGTFSIQVRKGSPVPSGKSETQNGKVAYPAREWKLDFRFNFRMQWATIQGTRMNDHINALKWASPYMSPHPWMVAISWQTAKLIPKTVSSFQEPIGKQLRALARPLPLSSRTGGLGGQKGAGTGEHGPHRRRWCHH